MNTLKLATAALLLSALHFPPAAARAAAVVSDGSDGAFHTFGYPTLDMNSLAPDGVFNFTTIHIPPGVVVGFRPNAANTPVFLAATGDILIEGTIVVSGRDYFATAGPGGGAPGLPSGLSASAGGGPAGGQPGGPATIYLPDGPVHGNAGGGGGMATAGAVAASRTGSDPGLGGAAMPRPVLLPGLSGGGGSGGGAGSGIAFFDLVIPGGAGGGGGGGLQLSTPGKITITGSILANGGHGAAGYGNGLSDSCGPGGGGAGGNIEIYAGSLELLDATLEARGGYGGSLSSEPQSLDPLRYSCGAHGGRGFAHVFAASVLVTPGTVIDAVHNLARPAWHAIHVQGSDVVLSGSAGRASQLVEVLSATNISLSIPHWTPISTNLCDAAGNFVLTNALPPDDAQRFFLLRSQSRPD